MHTTRRNTRPTLAEHIRSRWYATSPLTIALVVVALGVLAVCVQRFVL